MALLQNNSSCSRSESDVVLDRFDMFSDPGRIESGIVFLQQRRSSCNKENSLSECFSKQDLACPVFHLLWGTVVTFDLKRRSGGK